MNSKTTLAVLFLFLFSTTLGYAQSDIEIPPKIAEVLEYLQSKEATKAKGEVYKIRPVSWQIYDVDKDGTDEIFLQTIPRYAQSPTISIFQKTRDGTISKKLEGLAPGKLLSLTEADRFVDPHDIAPGVAKDVSLSPSNPQDYKSLADSAYKYGINVVLLKNYAHTDSRKGLNSFVDLTHLDTGREGCGNFKFAQPDQIAAGKMAGQRNNFFVAKVDDQLYCYEIKGFSRRGFLDKTVTTVPLPDDFLQLEIVKDQIRYRTKDDKVKPLKI